MDDDLAARFLLLPPTPRSHIQASQYQVRRNKQGLEAVKLTPAF